MALTNEEILSRDTKIIPSENDQYPEHAEYVVFVENIKMCVCKCVLILYLGTEHLPNSFLYFKNISNSCKNIIY